MPTILPAWKHYGTILRTWISDAFTIAEAQYTSGAKYSLHGNEQASLLLTLGGSCVKKMRSKDFLCERSSILFVPARALQSDLFYATTTFLAVEFASSFFSEIRRRCAAVETEMMLSGLDSITLGARLVEEFRHVDAVSALVFEGLILNILAGACREQLATLGPKPPLWLLRAREMLHESHSQSLDMATISREVGVHPVHLCREFRRFFRSTPGEYLRRIRVEAAGRLLRRSDMPLSEVAATCGFSDQAHLSRTFRRITNFSPLQYRRLPQ
jgi:AraC family transcriptional regulator